MCVVGLTAGDREEDIQILSHCLDKLPVPGLTTENANKCENKIRPFAPTEEAKAYYTRMEPGHKEQLKQKAATENKTRKEKTRSLRPTRTRFPLGCDPLGSYATGIAGDRTPNLSWDRLGLLDHQDCRGVDN